MKKVIRAILIIGVVLIAVILAAVVYVKKVLPNVGEASDIKVELTPARVARGEYLANHVTACMDCHSQRDWTKYAGPIASGTFGAGGEPFTKDVGFPGSVYSKNITPFNLHNWSDGQILRAVTTGETKDGSALFPIMGYPTYGKMDKEDIYSIIAYIRTLPELKSEIPSRKLDFPLNLLVNTMPTKASHITKPDSNNSVLYGQYLATSARCIECHSKTNKGELVAGTEFGGGREFDFPNGTTAHSANITADRETGIGNWSKETFVRRFKQYTDTSYHLQLLGKQDFNTPMPWIMYAGMTTKDLSAIYAYLQTVKLIKNHVNHFTRKS